MSASTFPDGSVPRTEAQRFVTSSVPFDPHLLLSGPGLPLTMLSNNSGDFELTVRQQPERARVAGGKEKGTWSSSQRPLFKRDRG